AQGADPGRWRNPLLRQAVGIAREGFVSSPRGAGQGSHFMNTFKSSTGTAAPLTRRGSGRGFHFMHYLKSRAAATLCLAAGCAVPALGPTTARAAAAGAPRFENIAANPLWDDGKAELSLCQGSTL